MNNTTRLLRFAIPLMALAATSPFALAQLQWGAGGVGGSATWNAANTNWYNGSTNVVWDSGTAVFGGTAGTVTVSGTQNATGLTFGTGGYTLSGGTVNLTGSPVISTSAGTTTINSVVNGSSGFTYTGTNTLVFGGSGSTLSGTVSQTNGAGGATIRVTQGTALGTAALSFNGGIFQIVSGTSQTVANNISSTGLLQINAQSGNHTITGSITPSGGVFYDITSGANLTLSGSAGLAQTGQTVQKITGTGGLIIDASGGASAAAFLHRAGTVQVNSVSNPFGIGGNVQIGGVSSQTPVLALNGANLNVTTFLQSPATSREISNIAAGGSTVSGNLNFENTTSVILRSAANSSLTVNNIVETGASVGTITIGSAVVANAGTVIFNAATAYEGTTTVYGGTLLANAPTSGSNSATGTGAVVVNAGTLGGTGQISPTGSNGISVASGASIAPGASIGTLTVNLGNTTGQVTMADSSTFTFELGTSGISLAAPGTSDVLSITGASAGDFNFAVANNTVNFSGGSNGFYKLFNTDLSNATLAGDTWNNLTYDLTTGLVSDGLTAVNAVFYVGTASNAAGLASSANIGDIYVQVIPEPSTSLLVGLGVVAGFLAYRRSRRSLCA